MTKVAEIETMCAQHQELREVAAVYRRELGRAAPDPKALADCRWRLLRLISGHIAYETAHLYPALRRCGAHAEDAGKRMASELERLTGQLHAHVREWTGERISGDWAGYRRTSYTLIDMLTARMDREEQDLYPLLDLAKAA